MDLGLGFDQAAIGWRWSAWTAASCASTPPSASSSADDGVGFDPPAAGERAAASGHLGLRSMAERLQTAGGRLEISSQPYQGTQVVLRLPD